MRSNLVSENGMTRGWHTDLGRREFVYHAQQQILALATTPGMTQSLASHIANMNVFLEDALSDDAIDPFTNPVMPLTPDLGNLPDIDQITRNASASQQGRESLTKHILEQDYLTKLVPLVEMAEDLEDAPSLHRLSNIMKTLILLNDNQIIEQMVSDTVILGVVGALECRS